MTKHTLYTALLALFVLGSAAVPLQGQTQKEGAAVTQMEQAFGRFGEPVTVHVTNNNWLDLRIYVVETTSEQRRWRFGNVTGLSTASFEIPDHLQADLGSLVLVAETIGSREQKFTDRLQTWPGALVDWRIEGSLSLSSATVF